MCLSAVMLRVNLCPPRRGCDPSQAVTGARSPLLNLASRWMPFAPSPVYVCDFDDGPHDLHGSVVLTLRS